MNLRRRPMRRVGDLLPQAAAALGIDEEFRRARAAAAWEHAVAAVVPAAAGASRLVGFRGDTAVVSASASALAQELLLHRDELLAAFEQASTGQSATDLRVVVQARQAGGPTGGATGWPAERPEPGV
jgi:hypothetical protein